MPVTLILTRNPLKSFQYGRKSGRWGELIAVKGPKITAVRLTAAAANSGSLPAGVGQLAAQAVAQVVQSVASSQSKSGGLPPAVGQLAAQAVAQALANNPSKSSGLPPAMGQLAGQAVEQVIQSIASSQPKNGGLPPAIGQLAAQAVAQVVQSIASPSNSGMQTIPVTNGVLQISTTGSPILDKKRFTSMERFKSDNGQGYYVQLRPKPEPYQITYEPGNSAVKEMRPDHDGRCFRVHGGKGRERGILIHEAPHVGWVIGCISPRPLNDFTIVHPNRPGNPSYQCMNELFQFVGRERADLFVLDW